MSNEIEHCKGTTSSGGPWGMPGSCTRKASTDAGYCKTHDPDSVAKRDADREAKWKTEWDEKDRVNRIRKKEYEALEVVKKIATGVEDPIETARSFIRELDKLQREGVEI